MDGALERGEKTRSMSSLHGKVAIVPGGATLIGTCIAGRLADAGAKVIIADINEPGPLPGAAGSNVRYLRTDICSDADMDKCIAQAIEWFGGIDVLVNVACTYLDNGMNSTREEWASALNVNLIGAALFAGKVAPHMRQRGGGAIVNLGSISAKIAQPGRMLYPVSKAAMLGLTRNLALLLAADQIRVNSVSPGWTWSNAIRALSKDNRPRADRVAADFHPVGRLIDPNEVADAVVFLCSVSASGITGADLAVDGGYSAIGPEQLIDRIAALAG